MHVVAVRPEQSGGRRAQIDIVVNEQYASARLRLSGAILGSRRLLVDQGNTWWRGNGRQANEKLAAAARSLAGGLNFAAVQHHETAHQRQADSQAPLRMVERAIPLGKEVE